MSSLCSRNARSQKTLVGRAQWGTHPSHPGGNVHERVWTDYLESLGCDLAGNKARPWAKRLSWQTQGGRVKQSPGLGG